MLWKKRLQHFLATVATWLKALGFVRGKKILEHFFSTVPARLQALSLMLWQLLFEHPLSTVSAIVKALCLMLLYLWLWNTDLTISAFDKWNFFGLYNFRLRSFHFWLWRWWRGDENFNRAKSLDHYVWSLNIVMMVVIVEDRISESTIRAERIILSFAVKMLSMGKCPCWSSLIVTLFDPPFLALPLGLYNDGKDLLCGRHK